MGDKAIKKVFGTARECGKEKLQAADGAVAQALTSLGPWGVALLAAYLAGQGLVQLANKIREWRTAEPARTAFDTQEVGQINEAVGKMEGLGIAVSPVVTTPGIATEHVVEPLSIANIQEEERSIEEILGRVDVVMTRLPPPGDPEDYCKKLQRALDMVQGKYDSLAMRGPVHLLTWGERGLMDRLRLEAHRILDKGYTNECNLKNEQKGDFYSPHRVG